MILYFSATGNCKYVASRLAQAEGQEMLSIVDCIRDGRYAFEDEVIEMRDGKPVWVKDKCVMCLGCLHRCPKLAYHQLTMANTVLAGRDAPILLQSH